MSFDASDASRPALPKAASFTRFHTSLALSGQPALCMKASIVCIASIGLTVVVEVLRGAGGSPGTRRGLAPLPDVTSCLDC